MKSYLIGALCILVFVSCNAGYQKEDGSWVWVSYDTGAGKRVSQIDKHDYESFEKLDDNYVKDINSVFHIRSKIDKADPNSFKLIEGGYSMDGNHVFLDDEIIIFANPQTFQLLEFPYSKDNFHIYCGTIPFMLDESEVKEFKVSKTGESMSNMKSSVLLSHFIEINPEYKWIDTLGVDGVIVGKWGSGETNNKTIKGFKILR
ncbi:MAG: DKNYY domain-containing protein [Saprospiraceae bacterium]